MSHSYNLRKRKSSCENEINDKIAKTKTEESVVEYIEECPILCTRENLTKTICCNQTISKEVLYRIQINFEEKYEPKCPFCRKIIPRINRKDAANIILECPINNTYIYFRKIINEYISICNGRIIYDLTYFRDSYNNMKKFAEKKCSIITRVNSNDPIIIELGGLDYAHMCINELTNCIFDDLNHMIEDVRSIFNENFDFHSKNNEDLSKESFEIVKKIAKIYLEKNKITHYEIQEYTPGIKVLPPFKGNNTELDIILLREIAAEEIRSDITKKINDILKIINERFTTAIKDAFIQRVNELRVN